MAPVQPQRRCDQLPAEVTGFVGREAELAQLTSVLAHARIVTVTGYGGVGKTRLALRAADRSAFRYPDGVILLDLATVRDPALLPPALAAALRPEGAQRRCAGRRRAGCPAAHDPRRPARSPAAAHLGYL